MGPLGFKVSGVGVLVFFEGLWGLPGSLQRALSIRVQSCGLQGLGLALRAKLDCIFRG